PEPAAGWIRHPSEATPASTRGGRAYVSFVPPATSPPETVRLPTTCESPWTVPPSSPSMVTEGPGGPWRPSFPAGPGSPLSPLHAQRPTVIAISSQVVRIRSPPSPAVSRREPADTRPWGRIRSPPPSRVAKIGKYELVRKLASGGMAEVFLAKFEWAYGLEKTVVVKRILQHLHQDPNFIAMFFSEAQLASRLDHPNIVQIIEFGESEDANFLAMEYVDGLTLRDLLVAAYQAGEFLPFGQCASIVAHACEALAYAHELTDPATGVPMKLVHRDVSLDNIIGSKAGPVKLMDFGIAKAVNQAHHTKTGVIKGKLSYMSPEQIRAQPLDRRVDVYGLGVVLYELVTGAKPFDNLSEAELLHEIVYGERIPMRERRKDAPPELERITTRALERDKERRYPDCRMMHADLESFLRSWHQPVNAFELAELIKRYSGDAKAGSGPVE